MLNDSALERQVAGALRSAITAHGPITRSLIHSATKRIAGQITAAQPPHHVDSDEAKALITAGAFALDEFLKTVTDKATLPIDAWKPHVTVILLAVGVLTDGS